MLEGRAGTRVLRLVDAWTPSAEYRNRSKFRDDLRAYLEDHLNDPEKAMYGRHRAHTIRAESGNYGADLSVDEAIGIVLEHEVDEVGALRGRVLDCLGRYPLVIVCACGFDETDGWNGLKRELDDSESTADSTIRFVEKFSESRTFRGGDDGGDGGLSGGGGDLDLGIRRR